LASRTQTINKQIRPTQVRYLFGAAFRAGFWGGVGISALLVVYQISSIPLLRSILIPPAMIIVWIVTGIGAAMLSGDLVRTSHEGSRVGVIAGLISGAISGITAMIIAAFGVTFVQYGEGILVQFSDTQLAALTESGLTEQLIILSGSIISALFACGVGGMFVAALLGGFGGWLYPKFSK
jgi:hypothetical protein